MAVSGRGVGREDWLGDRKINWLIREDEYEETGRRFSTEMRVSHFQKGNGLSASMRETSES